MDIAFETIPGSLRRLNEDWVAASPTAVVVLDGVTAPRVDGQGCHHSVAWFAQRLGGRLLMLLGEDNDLVAALGNAIEQVAQLHEHTCDLNNPGIPAAAVAVLRKVADDVEWLVLADTTVVVDTQGGLLVCRDARVDDAAPEARARTRREAIGTPEHQAAVDHMSVEQLQQRNIPGGYWVAAADRKAADYALTGRAPLATVRRVAIFTDGASRLVDTFDEMDWTACLDYLHEHSPRGLLRLVRQIEDGDPGGLRWPRYKKSDDATVALARL